MGLIDVSSYQLDKDTQKQLAQEFMIIDSIRINSEQETVDQYADNYSGDPTIDLNSSTIMSLLDEDKLNAWYEQPVTE